jgi:hypothetical protein
MNKFISPLVKAPSSWKYNDDGTKIKETFKGSCKTNWTQIVEDKKPKGKQFIIRTGQKFDLIVIDVDIKHGDSGLDTLTKYGIDLNKYPTLTFQTPSGGFHYFYKYNTEGRDYTGWTQNFLPFVDMIGNQKGSGWFVFHDISKMKCINNTEIVDMPNDLYESLLKSRKLKIDCNENVRDIDSIASTENSDDDDDDDDIENNEEEICKKYYDLLVLLDDNWYRKYNQWIEPAYALYNSEIDKTISFNTWNKLLKEKAGSKYDYDDAFKVWNKTIPETQEEMTRKNNAIITLSKFKKIIGGSKNYEYSIWKDKYEPSIKKEKRKSYSDLKEEKEQLYTDCLEELTTIINSYGKTMLYDDNNISFSDIQRLHRKTIDINDLALLINQTYVNVLQNGMLFLIIKEIATYRCMNTKEFKSNILFTKIKHDILDKDTITTIKFNDELVKIHVRTLIKDLSTFINNYDKVSFYPYGAKSIQNTPSNVFNVFTGFLYNYKEDFKQDDKIINTFRNMYKEILCNNVEQSFNFELKKLAHMIQHPEVKSGAVSIFKAGQGVGKSFLLMFLMKYVFGKHLSITIYDQKQLTNKFNSHLMGKLFCILEEGVDLGNPADIAMFKGMIRAPEINIEYKGVNVFDAVDCCMNFFIATNSDYNRLLGEADERTANFNICNEKYKRNTKYFGEMSEILNNYNAGEQIFHYLANIDLSDFDIRHVPENDEKLRKKINASPSFIRFLYKLYSNDIDETILSEFKAFSYKLDFDKKEDDIVDILTDDECFMKIMEIMNVYNKVCEVEFNTKSSSKTDIKEKFMDKYFTDNNKNEYKKGRWEYNFTKQSIQNALNKHFDTNEF